MILDISRPTYLPEIFCFGKSTEQNIKLQCWPMPNVMAALPDIGDALCSTPQSLADAHYSIAGQ